MLKNPLNPSSGLKAPPLPPPASAKCLPSAWFGYFQSETVTAKAEVWSFDTIPYTNFGNPPRTQRGDAFLKTYAVGVQADAVEEDGVIDYFLVQQQWVRLTNAAGDEDYVWFTIGYDNVAANYNVDPNAKIYASVMSIDYSEQDYLWMAPGTTGTLRLGNRTYDVRSKPAEPSPDGKVLLREVVFGL